MLSSTLFKRGISRGLAVSGSSSSSKAAFSTPAGPLRSAPSYAIFGEKSMLNIKIIPPQFRVLSRGNLVLDSNKKGRILLEWSPRAEGGGINRDLQIRVGLSAEEVGFLLHQLPDNEVEFVRKLPPSENQPGSVADDIPEKVVRITPGEGGQFAFTIDFEKNGQGGQTVAGEDAPTGPLEVVAQLGEYQVIRELLQRSIPTLVGWDTQMNMAIQQTIQQAINGGGNYNNGGNRGASSGGGEAAASF